MATDLSVGLERLRDGAKGKAALGAAAIGLLLGVVAGLDPLLADWLPAGGARRLFRDVPFLPAAGILALSGAMVLLLRYAERLPVGWHRYCLVALILSIHLRAAPGLYYAHHLVVLGFTALWLLDLMRRPDARLSPAPLQLLILLWFGVMALSIANGGLESTRYLLTEVKGVLIFLLVLHALESWGDVRFFVAVLLVVSAASALVAIGQVALYLLTGTLWVGAVDAKTLNLLIQEGGPLGLWLRPPAFFGITQALANTLAVAAAFTVPLLIARRPWTARARLGVGLVLMGIALAATASRGAALGFGIAAVFAVILLRPRWLAPLACVAALSALVAAHTPVRHAIERQIAAPTQIGNLAGRVEYAQESLAASFDRHPIIGAGLNKSYRYNANPYNYPAHNAFLLAFAENGILGLLVYTGLFVYVAIRLTRAVRRARDAEVHTTLVGLACAFIALLVHFQADPFYHLPLTWVLLALAEGAVICSAREETWREKEAA